MFSNLNALLRTVILGGLLAVAGWWTLLAREKLTDKEEELTRSRQEVSTLSMRVEERDREIRQLGVSLTERDEAIRSLEADVEERDRRIDALDVALTLLKVDTRVARVDILSQGASAEEPERVRTVLRFTEMGPEGKPFGEPRVLTVDGKSVYVDALVVKFQDTYVEQGDELRGTSLCLFRRVFGEDQQPAQGETLDPVGQQPAIYAGDDTPEALHGEIWRRFWDYANDPDLAGQLGIRAIHGDAPYIEARPGKSYWVELRSSGGLSIRPAE